MNEAQPPHRLHDRFCRTEGWQQVRDERAATGSRAVTYELTLPDGRTLRSRVARPEGEHEYGPSVWKHILRDQLQVSEPEFWACVHDGVPPDRGVPKPAADALPVGLVHLLINRVGMPESDVMAMSKDQAIARLTEHWDSAT